MISATVRQTPWTAIDAPREVSWVEPRMVRRTASPRCSIPATSPSSSTVPVNIRAFLLEAHPAIRLRGWRGYMRTRFARPGHRPRACCLPSGLSPSVPEFHQVSRPLAADGSRTFTAGSEFHRPRSTLTPIASVPYEVFPADPRYILRSRRSRRSRRQGPELVSHAVLGDQALTVYRTELVPEPADVHVNGTAVLRHGPGV